MKLGTGTSAGATTPGRYLQILPGSQFFQFVWGLTTSNTAACSVGGGGGSSVFTSSNGLQTALVVEPGISQTGTASYTALRINPTESTTGSGAKNLLDLQVGGVSKLRVDNTGTATHAAGADLAFDTTTGSKIGTGTTQKIGFWNATPAVQPTSVADATDATDVITQLNALLSRLRTIGLIAA
jgi:hypothetical protein